MNPRLRIGHREGSTCGKREVDVAAKALAIRWSRGRTLTYLGSDLSRDSRGIRLRPRILHTSQAERVRTAAVRRSREYFRPDRLPIPCVPIERRIRCDLSLIPAYVRDHNKAVLSAWSSRFADGDDSTTDGANACGALRSRSGLSSPPARVEA
jgi:hypothetical protein